jgi:ubiquinone/menaquinone biosynthesis C-methylase UbiE
MDARLQRRVQRYGWDKAAGHYETFWRRQLAPAQARLLALAALTPGARVLDVACGTGLVTFPAADAVRPGGSVVATDLSEAMVTRLAEAAAARGAAHVRAERMDAEDLRVPDASFDVALCALGLMYVPTPLKAMQEMHRVLRPGGRCVVAVWGRRDHCGWAEIFPIVERRVASEVCPLFFQLGHGETLRYVMGEAGFSGVSVERLSVTLHYDSDADACGAAFAGGPVALAYSHFDAAMREEAHAEYLASIAPWRAGSGYDVPGEFVIGIAENPPEPSEPR